MCVLSVVIDDQRRRWEETYPWVIPPTIRPNTSPPYTAPPIEIGPSQEEFNKLKREVEELRKLVEAAREYDRNTGQPDCESAEKIALLKQIAEALGVELEFLDDDAKPNHWSSYTVNNYVVNGELSDDLDPATC